LELGEVELFHRQTLLVTRLTMAGSSPFSQSHIWLGTIAAT
jgi:hypothetical protein